MARCTHVDCLRWYPDVTTRLFGIRVDGRWFCSQKCVENDARRRLSRPRWLAPGIPAVAPPRLGVLLRKAGVLTEEQLDRALTAQRDTGLRLGAQLRSLGLAGGDVVLRSLAEQAGVGFLTSVDLRAVARGPGGLSSAAARALGVVPVCEPDEGKLKVACTAPIPRLALSALRQITGLTPVPHLVDDELMPRLLTSYGEAGAHLKTQPRSAPATSVSEAAERIAVLASGAGTSTVAEAHWRPFTWIRVKARGVVEDVLLSRTDEREHSWRADTTSR